MASGVSSRCSKLIVVILYHLRTNVDGLFVCMQDVIINVRDLFLYRRCILIPRIFGRIKL